MVIGCVVLVLVGCSRRRQALTPVDFAFVTTNTTVKEIVRRVGQPNRIHGKATNDTVVVSYEWDLPSTDPANSYVMVLKVDQGAGQRVLTAELVRQPGFIDFSTNQNH